MVEEWENIPEVLDELTAHKEQKADTRRMDELETAIMATVLGCLNRTSISLQYPTVSLNTAASLIASLIDTVQFARNRFDVY